LKWPEWVILFAFDRTNPELDGRVDPQAQEEPSAEHKKGEILRKTRSDRRKRLLVNDPSQDQGDAQDHRREMDRESFRVAPQEVDKLISGLTAWCRAQHGRQREIAAMLGVSEQLVSNWLARRKTPTLQHGLQIQEFLNKQRKSRKKDD
jgi:transcriptional regulator with XRE-family HTH domain